MENNKLKLIVAPVVGALVAVGLFFAVKSPALVIPAAVAAGAYVGFTVFKNWESIAAKFTK